MAAFLTLSQRSLRFESWLMEMFTNWGKWLGARIRPLRHRHHGDSCVNHLRSLTRPSMAAFLTLSQRSLRFESWLMEMFTNWGKWLGRQDSNLGMPESKSGALPLGDAPLHEERFSSKDQL